MPSKERSKELKIRLKKKPLVAIILIELLLFVILLGVASNKVSLNHSDEITYADDSRQDVISCSDGELLVNNVAISVPQDKEPTYNISYSWAKTDTDYPSVPKSITALYKDAKGNSIYDISLYRESFTPSSNVPTGKTADTWFDDWDVTDDPTIKKSPLTAGSVKGFSITNLEDGKDGSTPYLTDSFYFAVNEKDGVSIYVIEGILYNSDLKDKFIDIMRSSTNSIVINKNSIGSDKESTQEA